MIVRLEQVLAQDDGGPLTVRRPVYTFFVTAAGHQRGQTDHSCPPNSIQNAIGSWFYRTLPLSGFSYIKNISLPGNARHVILCTSNFWSPNGGIEGSNEPKKAGWFHQPVLSGLACKRNGVYSSDVFETKYPGFASYHLQGGEAESGMYPKLSSHNLPGGLP